ncbi:DUF402 domain-containing protein [Luteococcus peritonei]|uniref:DUF402 domain-containing protein n=1 Tax=Luteococcus peritonei TaxID=88874 RepID=A0ABW4RTK2_9ACTN
MNATPQTRISASGGSMRLLGRPHELSGLDLLQGRTPRGLEVFGDQASSWQPRLRAGDELLWCLGESMVTTRVVLDDEQGLVAWLSSGSETTVRERLDGRHARQMPAHERFSGDFRWLRGHWRGDGILRATRPGQPWSVWWFWRRDGRFNGWYVNLELPHRRERVGRGVRTITRDLLLDLWVDADARGRPARVWLKDFDELEAAVELGEMSPPEVDAVWTLAQRAIDELVRPVGWPLGEGLEGWRAPTGWGALPLPDSEDVLALVGRRGRASRAVGL